jgi:hypothetical protein
MANWRKVYLSALAEPDSGRFDRLAYDAEAAIVERMEDIAERPDRHAELYEMEKAVTRLLALRTVRLRWPNVA